MVILAAAASVAAATAFSGKKVFSYNRENFCEDREQRLKMELALRKFRVVQAELWREDVRGFISLTEKKMSIYLLVNVLMLGFTLNLWCEGRLPERTPEWLVMGNQIAIAGAFAFLLLTVWLAVHASVAAQSYQTRILTQLVRLPVPTWEELEACRTYASDFERVGAQQMLRVPFLQGPQEDLVARSVRAAASSEVPTPPESDCQQQEAEGEESGMEYAAASVEGGLGMGGGAQSEASPFGGVSTVCDEAAERAVAADPWGLERDGQESVYELGCPMGEEVAKLRHVKLIRQAAVYWQTYDAFARVSMSLGVTQLMLAMSYYMLGYVLTQVRAPVPAFAGVVVLMGTAEVVARIDLTLPVNDQRLVQFLMLFGPSVSCVSTYLWAQHEDLPARIAEALTPVAFLSHGLVVALLTMVLRVREQENGAMLPLAYQGVLYLDVFGWVAHKRAGPSGRDSASGRRSTVGFGDATPSSPWLSASSSRRSSFWEAARVLRAPWKAPVPGQAAKEENVPAQGGKRRSWLSGWWRRKNASATARAQEDTAAKASANFFAEGYVTGLKEEREGRWQAEEEEQQAGAPTGGRPALRCVARDGAGQPLPMRPEDVVQPGTADDCRHVPGAPRMWDTVNAIEPPAREFWDATTFMPSESRERQQMDDFLAEVPNFGKGGLAGLAAGSGAEDAPLETGHDNEVPGVLPWAVVRMAAVITSTVWILAGCYCILQVAHIWSMRLPWWWEIPALESNESAAQHWRGPPPRLHGTGKLGQMVLLKDGRRNASLHSPDARPPAGASSPGSLAERVAVTWPYPTARPRGLACDAAGGRFLASDGLSVFAASLAVPSPSGPKRVLLASLRRRSALATATSAPAARPTLEFRRVPGCLAVMGDAVQDVALLCSPSAASGAGAPAEGASALAGCEALILHRRGRSLASCPLEGAGPGRSLTLARGWLQRAGNGQAAEEVSSVLADPSCLAGMPLGPLGHGCIWVGTTRGRAAQLRVGGDGAVLVPEDVLEGAQQPPWPGSLRPLAEGSLAALGPNGRELRLLSAGGGLAEERLELPEAVGPVGAFCAGGGAVFALGNGPAPGLWRLPLGAAEESSKVAAADSRTALSRASA